MINTIKNISIAFGQYHNFRRIYRVIKQQNVRESEILLSQFRNLNLEGKLVFDIGANIGIVSEALLESGARVVAIEPNITLLPELKARCSNSELLVILPVAISSTSKISKFYIPEYSGQASFSEDWSDNKSSNRMVFVPALSFQKMVETFGMPFYVKIDVEGHEYDVICGMETHVPLVSFEFHMDQKRCAVALKIMKQYELLGPFFVNVMLEGEDNMYFKDFISYTDFGKEFLSLCARENGRNGSYGQCFLKSIMV